MKNVIFLLCVTLIGFSGFAQQDATINIVGHATKLITPDKAIFSINIRANRKTEPESFKAMTDMSDEILKRLKKEGFAELQIKLTDYSIQMEYDYSSGKPKKLGYISSESLIVKFPLDKRKILNVYSNLTDNDVEGVSINFGTECSDSLKNKVQNDLIVVALHDAKQKAELIASTTECKIKSVADVSYKLISNMPYPQPMNTRYSMKAESGGAEASDYFSINEMEFDEEIKVTYWILNNH